MHVTPEAAELRHCNRRFETAGLGKRRGELGPSVERVMALAGLYLDILGGDGRAFPAASTAASKAPGGSRKQRSMKLTSARP
jgi:hypothetical protein